MILTMSPLPALSHADGSALETILVEKTVGMIAVSANSRSSMCNSLVAMIKYQFHGKIQKYVSYLSTERPSIPAGNSTLSKKLFAISSWRKICPRASILLSCHVAKTHPFIPVLLVATGQWSVARKHAALVVTSAKPSPRMWSRMMARLREPSINTTLAKNVCTVATHAERNALAAMNIQRGAWKDVDNLASMHSVTCLARSPALLVRNLADGEHRFLF